MIKFIRYIPKVIHLLYILSKYRVLTDSGHFELPFSLKVLGRFFSIILYPIGLFTKSNLNFGQRLAGLFQSLGPIYIKFGQTLSTRPDLIGTEVADSLKYLQDKLPPFSYRIVKARIEERFGQKLSDLFDSFDDTPVAAASIAQVHKAKLKSGEIVAVKILRPNIAQKYEEDIAFLEYGAEVITRFLKKAKRLRPKEVMSVFRQSMNLELNLRSEAAAASRILDNFANDSSLHIPRIYWNLTHDDIITLEWIDGVSIYDREAIKKLGFDPKDIAAKIAVIFFNQAYRDGFFHADLHPGNILVCPNGKVALVDFGIIGILAEDDRLAIAEILYAFLKRDYKLVAEVHQRVGYIPKDTNLEYFAQSCRAVAEPIIGIAIKNISIGNLLAQLFKVTEEYGMETQPQLLLLQKTMVVVEGIGQSLDEDINMWLLAEPWIKKWAAKNLSPEAKLLRMIKKILNKLV
ncbi:2-polyprenylphenol 6-hydroxylase [Candidatus Megaera venefica]|uniref:2-polyprenylphenol 6-hydroxylase n=1 Tax=Candidatus Megaera venefica TaxID=2055910 RepID=A0ABU5NC60_9RICK|nr:2-polyprenylphenol 6-hydroxylase [Candidatus Megaera venefica]MEA0970764.1 2-polyprenylphenol 6-hydroxylase [Candidatus Megaera venefica]